MTYEELLDRARAAEGQILKTATGREFRVGIYMDCPFFIPMSTELGRSDGRKAVERFLEIYNETGSTRLADYANATRNASYLLPLVRLEP